MITKKITQQVNLEVVKLLYPEAIILQVEEFYIPMQGWTSLFEGKHIATNDTTIEEQIQRAIAQEATTVNLKIISKEEVLYVDYTIRELTNQE